MRKFDLLDHFKCVVSGEEVEKGKPAPDVYLKAAELLGVDPEHCMVLEDARHGVAAAEGGWHEMHRLREPEFGESGLIAGRSCGELGPRSRANLSI